MCRSVIRNAMVLYKLVSKVSVVFIQVSFRRFDTGVISYRCHREKSLSDLNKKEHVSDWKTVCRELRYSIVTNFPEDLFQDAGCFKNGYSLILWEIKKTLLFGRLLGKANVFLDR